MTKYNAIAINQCAENFYKKFVKSYPVDIYQIIRSVGGEIVIEEFDDLCEGDAAKIEGNNTCFRIRINPYSSENQRIHALAIAFGNIVLNMGFLIDWKKWEKIESGKYIRLGLSDDVYKAMDFTYSIMMPFEEFKKSIDKNKDQNNRVDVEAVAKEFNVGMNAVILRGRFIGILKD